MAYETLLPGVRKMFTEIGAKDVVIAPATPGFLIVYINLGGQVLTRTFPEPAMNSELSGQLKAWRDELA